MQFFFWLALVIVIAVSIFAVQNSTAPPVMMKFLFWDFQTSLIYTLLGAIGAGMLIIFFLWIPSALRASIRQRNLNRRIADLEREKEEQAALRGQRAAAQAPENPPGKGSFRPGA